MSANGQPHATPGETIEWQPPSCAQCDELSADLRRIRAERNALLIRVHELEQRAAPSEASAPAPSVPPASHTWRGHQSMPLLGPAQSMPSMPSMPSMQPPPPPAPADFNPAGAAMQAPPLIPEQSPAAPMAGLMGPPVMLGGIMSRGQGLDFGAVSRLTPDELDGLPYGLITVDAEGRVVHYNDTESRMVGLPKDRVIGRNFFADVAPCTRVRAFEGRFRELARDPSGVRVQSFDFAFAFAHSEQHVSIVMTSARRRGHFHLALLRRAIRAR